MKINKTVQKVAVVAGCLGALVLTSAADCTGTDQQDPTEKTFEMKDGSKVRCLVIYDETGKVIEETVACSPIEAAGQPTAK